MKRIYSKYTIEYTLQLCTVIYIIVMCYQVHSVADPGEQIRQWPRIQFDYRLWQTPNEKLRWRTEKPIKLAPP